MLEIVMTHGVDLSARRVLVWLRSQFYRIESLYAFTEFRSI